MAGNENSGRIPTFHLSEKELESKIEQYKIGLENGEFARASLSAIDFCPLLWYSFCTALGEC